MSNGTVSSKCTINSRSGSWLGILNMIAPTRSSIRGRGWSLACEEWRTHGPFVRNRGSRRLLDTFASSLQPPLPLTYGWIIDRCPGRFNFFFRKISTSSEQLFEATFVRHAIFIIKLRSSLEPNFLGAHPATRHSGRGASVLEYAAGH